MELTNSQTTFNNLPPQLLQVICFTMLEIEEMWKVMSLSKKHYNLLRLSKYSIPLFLNSLTTRFDLPPSVLQASSVQVLETRLKYLLELFQRMKSDFQRPRLARFYAFKTNMGADCYPHPRFSFTNLFEPSYSPYCSDSMSGPALVQGVYIPEDTGKFYEDDQRIKDLIDGKLKVIKRRETNDGRFNATVDEQRAQILVGMAKFLQRAIQDQPITHHSIYGFPMFQVAHYFEISTIIAKRNFPHLGEEELRKEIAKNMNHLRSKGLEYNAKTAVDFHTQRDEESMEQVRKTWPKYIEVNHKEQVEQVRDDYLMIHKFKVSAEGEFNCPVKTLALFAHNQEFSYDQGKLPGFVKQVTEECKTSQDIQKLIQKGVIPSMISGHGIKSDFDNLYSPQMASQGLPGSQIVFFDPKNRELNLKNQGIRLIAWISCDRKQAPFSELEVFLPRPITTKFVTAAFIESENLIPEQHRNQFPDPNVDCSFILFSGNRLPIPAEIFE